MDKSILLIGDKKSFMVKAVISGLESNGFDVNPVGSLPDDIKKAVKGGEVCLLYCDNSVDAASMACIRDIIDDRDIKLFAIGLPEDFSRLFPIIPRAKIEDVFERPFSVDNVANKLAIALMVREEGESKKRILLVDDDQVSLNAIKSCLAKQYKVYVANSGVNAIAFLARNEVDLILMDYEMPVTSGAQVFEMLRSEPTMAKIPVMFLTSKQDKDTVMKLVALKPEKYLLKTMPPEALREQIESYFHSKLYDSH